MVTANIVKGEIANDGRHPLVTVITPTYRRDPSVVRRCINCMMLQDNPDWEQLVCSDSVEEPNIRQMIASLGDSRVRYYNTSVKKAGDYGHTIRNELIKIARGRYVMFFDDDNVISPNYVSKMVHAIESTGRDFAVCSIVHFGPLNIAETGPPPKVLTGVPLKLYHVDTLQVMVRTGFMRECGWNTEMGYVSDGYSIENLGIKSKNGYAVVSDVLGFHL